MITPWTSAAFALALFAGQQSMHTSSGIGPTLTAQNEISRPETTKPEANQAATEQAATNQAATNQSGSAQSGTTGAGTTQVGGSQASPKDQGINGAWHFVLDTPGGDRDVDAEFAVDADGKVSGTWGKTTTAGLFKDSKLTLVFEFTSEETDSTDTMKIDGRLEDSGSLSGTWHFSSYEGTFKAFRPKASHAKS